VSAPHPQHDLRVRVRGKVIETRFFIATASATPRLAQAPLARALPVEALPEIPDDHRVILFLHGHSSRAEEAMDLIGPLLAEGRARGRPFAVVALDLPCNGYSSMLDHTEVAESSGTSFPAGIFDRGPVHTPLLDFLEDFVVAFVDALDAVVPIKHRFAGIIGGSLGGNLGLRLGRRDLSAHPWLGSGIVSWAPASVWAPMVEDEIKRRAPEHCREKWNEAEDDGRRAAYFGEVFDQVLIPLLVPHTQPSMWYRSGWEPHKSARIQSSRRDRYEVYNALFRRWHWRVAGEQLIYSHIDRVDRQSPSSPMRHSLNRARHLLAAGDEDDYPGSNIYSATRHLAERMAHTPGRSIFLLGTGHSIHAERPRYLAREIASFLTEEADAAR
jgi:pimeloyl-ACP methyl ester carboxylesterase